MNLEGRVRNNQTRYEKSQLLKHTLFGIAKPVICYLGGAFAMDSIYRSELVDIEEHTGSSVIAMMGTTSVIISSFGSLIDSNFLGKYNDEFLKIGLPIILGTNFVSYCYERYKKAKEEVYGK